MHFHLNFGFRPIFMGELLVSGRVNMLRFRISALSTGRWPVMQAMGRRRDKALEEGKNYIEWGGKPNPDMAGCKTFQIEEVQP